MLWGSNIYTFLRKEQMCYGVLTLTNFLERSRCVMGF